MRRKRRNSLRIPCKIWIKEIKAMNNFDNLKNDFIKKWKQDGSYLAKNLYGNLLDWEDILNILNKEIRVKKPLNILSNNKNNFEIVYKDLIAVKQIADWNGPLIESDATFFFSLFFDTTGKKELIPESISNKIYTMNKIIDIKIKFTSLKIALADKFVPYEYHDKNTIVIQLQGTNNWSLRDRITQNVSSYFLEPGDCLLFKSNMDHSLTNESPRSSIVGTFILGDSHEQ
jgi:hypothetical protein